MNNGPVLLQRNTLLLFLFYKNLFYKNVEAEINENLRTKLRTLPRLSVKIIQFISITFFKMNSINTDKIIHVKIQSILSILSV